MNHPKATHPASPIARPVASDSEARVAPTYAGSVGLADMKHPHHQQGGVGVGRRLSGRQLQELAEQLSGRDHQIVQLVSRFRLVRGDHIHRVFFSDFSSEHGGARVCRRTLQRLTEVGLLARTQRRVGGVRPGSSTHTYLVTPAGRRVVAHVTGGGPVSDRGVHEPGLAFHVHTLAISDLYTRAIEAEREGLIELVVFDPEPHSWRQPTTGTAASLVKPDAYVVVAAGDYEHSAFVEIDLATEGRTALARKLQTYVTYHRSGREQAERDVFPRVLWLTPTPERAAVIQTLINALPRAAQRLFAIAVTADAVAALTADETGDVT